MAGKAASGSPHAEAVASFFIDESNGWIAIVRIGPDILQPNETRTWLMKTEDGGRSWRMHYSDQAIQINRLYFNGAQEGWAVGSKRIRRDTLQNDPLVLYSTDGGTNWDIISDSLPKGIGFLEDVHYDRSSSAVTVLSADGRVFSRKKSGADWQPIAAAPDESDGTYYGRLGNFPDNRLWILGGMSSFEGTYGILAFKGSEERTWFQLKTRAYLNDALFFTAEKVIACGFTRDTEESSNEKQGIILRSTNGGRNWLADSQINSRGAITALARAGNRIWAVGEHGYVAMLEESSSEKP